MTRPRSSATTSDPRTALDPFNKPSADLILRSADLVDFRVHSQILAEASPFFASMLALPQPPRTSESEAPMADDATATGEDATPVVPVSEDSKALDLLLRLVYPIPKPRAQMNDPHTMVPALLAAAKYDMALPTEIISEQLIAIVKKKPLQVWAAACRTGLEKVARQAAGALKSKWTAHETEALACMDELELVDMSGISAGDYYRLKRFLTATDRSSVEEGIFALLKPSPGEPIPPPVTFVPFAADSDLPSTDVICRSASRGGQETRTLFAAHQVVLSMRSPVLKARLAELRASQAATTAGHGLSPIQVELNFDEEAEVLSLLLGACYDAVEAWPTNLSNLADLIVASQKYKMESIVAQARAAWDKAARIRPLEAYFAALSHGLKGCAEEAANTVTGAQVKDVYVPLMETAPALAYHRLLRFYDSCCAVVKAHVAQEVTNIPPEVSEGTYHDYYGHRSITISTKPVATALGSVLAARGEEAKEGLRKTLADTILPAIASLSSSYPSATTIKLVHSIVRCVACSPDALYEALKVVEINLG